MKYLMGVDNGGTFAKAALFSEDGRQVSVANFPTKIVMPRPGYMERDMDELWKVNVAAIKQAISKSGINPSDIAGISFCGHGKGLYLMGSDGKPSYNGIISTDERAWEYVERWEKDGITRAIYPYSYQKVLACQPVSLIAWFKEHNPDVLNRTKYIFSVKDYIRYKVTGKAYAEYTDFSGANLVDLNTKKYNREMLALFGIDDIIDKLPELCNSSDICGYVTKEVAELTGLPEGIPAAAGMFDVDACGIASGLSDEEKMCMIAGTWSINEYICKRPIVNGTIALNSMFCIPEYYLIEESSPTSASNLEWFIRNVMNYESKEEGKSIYALANEMVSSVNAQDGNLFFLPFINGSNEDPLAKGSFIGLTSYHQKKHLLRAIYEGVVFSHYFHIQNLLKNRNQPKSIRLSGGASNSDIWVHIFADVMQIPIDVLGSKEAGAQGAAMVAGIASGIYCDYVDAINKTVKIKNTVYPNIELKNIYQEKYETYRMINDALKTVWSRFPN